MLNAAVVDVAIGLALIFFVCSMAVSGIYEGVAKILAWRSKTLWGAIHVLVDKPQRPVASKPGERLVNATPTGDKRPTVVPIPEDPAPPATGEEMSLVDLLYSHPLIGALEQRAVNAKTRIDHIDPGNFARALIDLVVPDANGKTTAAAWTAAVENDKTIPIPGHLKRQLLILGREAGEDLDRLRSKTEEWFDAQMTRLSRRYRKRARFFAIGIAIPLAWLSNVDAIAMTRTLYSDPVVRSALVTQAELVTGSCKTQSDDAAKTHALPTAKADLDACLKKAGSGVGKAVSLPVGRKGLKYTQFPALSVLGWLLSGLAIAQGAPFWYGILKRIIGIRRRVGGQRA